MGRDILEFVRCKDRWPSCHGRILLDVRENVRSNTTSGEMSAETTQQRIDAALRLVAQWEVAWSRSKVLRSVRRYERDAQWMGWTLFEFLANAVALPEYERQQARARAAADPDNLVLLAYRDKTGEDAVNNIRRREAA